MIRNVIFDIGRVLIGFEWDDYVAELFEDEEVRKAVTAATFGNGLWNELDRGIQKEEDIYRQFVECAPEYEAQIKLAYDRVGECTTRTDYAIPWIDSLKAQGLNVYYLSNYSEHALGLSRHALDFLPHMDGGIFSCRVKSAKPEAAIYGELFNTFKLDPHECIFIDDRAENIEAGRSFGMDGIVFENYEQASKELCKRLNIMLE